MGLDAERYADGKRQADAAEQRFMDTWASASYTSIERSEFRNKDSPLWPILSDTLYEIFNRTDEDGNTIAYLEWIPGSGVIESVTEGGEVTMRDDVGLTSRHAAEYWLSTAPAELIEEVKAAFGRTVRGIITDEYIEEILGGFLAMESDADVDGFGILYLPRDWFFRLDAVPQATLINLLNGSAIQRQPEGASFLQTIGNIVGTVGGAYLGWRATGGSYQGLKAGAEAGGSLF
jgi:hypothetical protein